jgi:serine/threonine-protein kinase
MGEVWRAHDTVIDRIVAVKVLPAHLADDETFAQRFRREAHAAAQLNNPHVIPIHNSGEIDGRLYLDMRLIEGRDLQTVLADGPLEPARAVPIIEQVAKALHAAHKVGLVHRDVKPSNILLDEDDFAYLIDFGIARGAEETRMTGTGSIIGSWAYMSPERLQAGQVDARSDIYALTCVLYECLTGSPPYPGDNLEQQITAHLTAAPPRPSSTDPDVPAAFDAVIATGMAKRPDQRYPTTVELAHAARDATTVPLPRPKPIVPIHQSSQPDQLTAGPIHGQDTQLAGTAPVLPPPQSPAATPTPKRRLWRPRIVIPALVVIALLIGGGVFAAVKVSQPQGHKPTATAPPNTGPFTGIYTADYGPDTRLDGRPVEGATPSRITWGVRSVCRSSGCVATASRLSGDPTVVPTRVFDDVDGRWLAVAIGKCNNPPAETWVTVTLQPRPDGTLFGESIHTSNGCAAGKSTVTFTRTGDVDVNSLPDPATEAPRVVSPAEALRGHYHNTLTGTEDPNDTQQYDFAARTDCLRTGDRCMSFFHVPGSDKALVFGNGKWIMDRDMDAACVVGGGPSHSKITAEFPLPQPPQDPITLLTGHGHWEMTGSCSRSTDFEEKFVRTGD